MLIQPVYFRENDSFCLFSWMTKKWDNSKILAYTCGQKFTVWLKRNRRKFPKLDFLNCCFNSTVGPTSTIRNNRKLQQQEGLIALFVQHGFSAVPSGRAHAQNRAATFHHNIKKRQEKGNCDQEPRSRGDRGIFSSRSGLRHFASRSRQPPGTCRKLL